MKYVKTVRFLDSSATSALKVCIEPSLTAAAAGAEGIAFSSSNKGIGIPFDSKIFCIISENGGNLNDVFQQSDSCNPLKNRKIKKIGKNMKKNVAKQKQFYILPLVQDESAGVAQG